ncbi:DEAD/DEAH box helicase [Vibrio cyclitrophicus]
MLRRWQSECIGNATAHYIQGNKHFLAQATPGAGKTFMAANLAKGLFERSMIDFVICFSPSKTVSSSIQSNFSETLQDEMDGKFGSLGTSITYQSITHLDDKFWNRLLKYRVLCVFDEIHHCGGDNNENSNVWGQLILCKIKKVATYTLALTGTPWRSNLTPVVLSSYSDPEGTIVCDYQYTLAQAVQDGVCRKPTITLIDCDKSTIKLDNYIESFNSFNELISESEINYSTILNNKPALIHILGTAVTRLKKIRSQSPYAGGLIVATSVNHAIEIASLLKNTFNQTTTIVTYKNDDSQVRIKQFRTDYTEWIVSVGMVSEGTDIPRLQVCCHLSNIKTELYFRQILGRILRMTSCPNQEAWLYTFAAPKLIEFAEEVERDIPDSCRYLRRPQKKPNQALEHIATNSNLPLSDNGDNTDTVSINFSGRIDQSGSTESESNSAEIADLTLTSFKQRVIEAFQYL